MTTLAQDRRQNRPSDLALRLKSPMLVLARMDARRRYALTAISSCPRAAGRHADARDAHGLAADAQESAHGSIVRWIAADPFVGAVARLLSRSADIFEAILTLQATQRAILDTAISGDGRRAAIGKSDPDVVEIVSRRIDGIADPAARGRMADDAAGEIAAVIRALAAA